MEESVGGGRRSLVEDSYEERNAGGANLLDVWKKWSGGEDENDSGRSLPDGPVSSAVASFADHRRSGLFPPRAPSALRPRLVSSLVWWCAE